MSYALGQPVPLTLQVRDIDGSPADGGAVTLTVTQPDGTTITPTVTRPDGTGGGLYVVDLVPTMPGLHGVRWDVTGVNASAPSVDSLYVEAPGVVPLVSLAEAIERLGLKVNADSERDALAARIRVASAKCEEWTGRVWARGPRTVTRRVDAGRSYVTVPGPVVSVTSVTVDGASATVGGIDSEAGIVRLGTPTSGAALVVLSYVAGPLDGTVPPDVRQGVLELVAHLWAAMRSGTPGPRRMPDEDPYPAGYALPHRVVELWREHQSIPGGLG